MRAIKTIVIHHSGNSDTKEKIHELHVKKNGWNEIGYHFLISREGEIINCRNLEKEGAHVYGYNIYSIGVCLLGNFDKEKPHELQIKKMNELISNLKKEFYIKEIKFHREFPNVTKSCPGKNINKTVFNFQI